MKKIFVLLVTLLGCIELHAQNITIPYGTTVNASSYWTEGSDREFHVKHNTSITDFSGKAISISQIYSYDKDGIAYVQDSFGNYTMLFSEYSNKQIKKQLKEYNVPNLKGQELEAKRNAIDEDLEKYFVRYNDSIRADKEEKARLAKIETDRKAKEQKRQDSISADNYRKTHNWQKYNHKETLYCSSCEEIHNNDSLYILGIVNDTIYYLNYEPSIQMIGYTYGKLHYSKLTSTMKESDDFKTLTTMWADSIAAHQDINNDIAKLLNYHNLLEFSDQVRKAAPYGYIVSWGWELNSAAGIEPSFEYFNTSKKTIKYIDFYFAVYNPVGDMCHLQYQKGNIGHVRGVGPVESWDSGSWNWDSATHYTSYDASEMKVQKLVITYMDGTTKIIPKNQIVFN